MKKYFLSLTVLLLMLTPSVSYASGFDLDLSGDLSVGIGAGFGDNDVGPFVVSGKYWDEWLEIGAELMYDGDEEDQIDQLALLWLLYRQNLHNEENNTPWLGVGIGQTFEADSYEDSFGFVTAMGWEGRQWGMELKWGYFDPSLYSFVVYYHFN